MTAKENIEEKLHNLAAVIGSDEKLVDNVMSRINEGPNFNCSKNKTQNIWRIIMKSPISKIAVAAVIIIAVTFGLFNVELNRPAYGITDVPAIIRQAETIHIKTWTGIINVPIIDALIPNQDRKYREDWIDLKNGKYNIETFISATEKKADVFDGQYIMHINQSTKSAQFEKLSEFKRILSLRQLTDKFLEEIYLSSDELTGFSRSGKEQIDGEDYEIWEKIQGNPQSIEYKFKYWVSPSSGRLRKYQRWTKSSGTNEQWQLIGEKDVEINQIPPENIFKTEVPEGYRASNTKENAIIQKLIAWPIILGNMEGEINTMMALPDGTVIMGWNTNYVFQTELLEKLNPGDEIPAGIPIELAYDLRPQKNPENISYSVRHFAVTHKDGVFYEWYIYVPNKDMSNMNLSRECQIAAGLHTSPQGKTYEAEPFPFSLNLDVLVQKDEFDTWVRGAMAELSEDGKAPADVTYEKTLRLAQQIRESPAK